MTVRALLSKVSSKYIVMALTKSDGMVPRMTRIQSEAAKARYQREALEVCPTCDGTGVVVSERVTAKARKGGVRSYQLSLKPGQLSMAEPGAKGGRPKDPTLKNLMDRDRGIV